MGCQGQNLGQGIYGTAARTPRQGRQCGNAKQWPSTMRDGPSDSGATSSMTRATVINATADSTFTAAKTGLPKAQGISGCDDQGL